MEWTTPNCAYWFTAGNHDAGLLRARYVRQSFTRHTHDGFVFCVNESGAHGSWFRGSNVVIPARAITVVPAGEVHTGHSLPGVGWEYRAIYPGDWFLRDVCAAAGVRYGSAPEFKSLFVHDDDLADAFVRAHQQCEASGDALEREVLVSEMLLRIIRRHAAGRRRRIARATNQHITRAVDLMRSSYDQPLTLQALGDAVGLNRFAVLRGFRRAVGISPHAFLIQVRVERAKQMLAAGIGIATVSQRVGFADQSHLNRHFKRLVGVTPAVYARGVRADARQ